MKLSFDFNSQSLPIDLTPGGSGRSYRAVIEDEVFQVEIIRAENGRLDLRILRLDHPISDSHSVITAYVSSDNTKRWVTVNGQTFVLTKSSGAKQRSAGHDHASELIAPMPGVVRSVNISEGNVVTKGQTLLLLEAMKMEIRVQAPRDGIVKKLFVKQGQTVEREQILVEIEEE